jgi:hypothetical protein
MFEPQVTEVAGFRDPTLNEPFSPFWRKRLAPYCKPDAHRAVRQLFITSTPFLASMTALSITSHRRITNRPEFPNTA